MSKKFLRVRSIETNDHLRKTAPFDSLQSYWRMKHINNDHKIFNPADFSQVIGQLVAPIFQSSNSIDTLSGVQLDIIDSGPMISTRNHNFKHFSDYQARFLMSFASSFQPYSSVPDATSTINSFKWYRKLLSDAPVIIFMRQKQRLMSETSLLSRNTPFEKFREEILNISSHYADSPEYAKRMKNYHLTDLTSSDLFRLALQKSDKSRSTSECPSTPPPDKLYEAILESQKPRIVDENGNEIGLSPLHNITKEYPLNSLERKLLDLNEPKDVVNFLPYDLVYNDIYILSIESPVIDDNHHKLLQLLHSQSDFEIFALRLSSSLLDFTNDIRESEEKSGEITKNFDAKYADLLSWAEQQHQTSEIKKPGTAALLKTFGSWGFVEVSESPAKDSLYLFK